jgi:hypothetical protein
MRRRVKSKLVAAVPFVPFSFVLYGGALVLVTWVRS